MIFFHTKEKEKCYLVEDINKGCDHEFLFHLINFCKERDSHLLLTGNEIPNTEIVDLESRLEAMDKILIKNPSDDLLLVVLAKSFSDRQIRIGDDVLSYIMKHISRSFGAVKDVVNRLDRESLRKKKAITIPFVKEIM